MNSHYIYKLLLCVLVAVPLIAPVASAEAVLFISDKQYFYTTDPTTGSSTLVGDFGVTVNIAGLGYDPINDILYGTTTGSNSLYSINYSAGAASLIGGLGARLMHALAYDPSSAKLYGAFGEVEGDGFYQIDVSTGSATLIGHTGFFHSDHRNTVSGLAVHPQTHVLYGAVSGTALDWGALIEIDKSTGQGTLIAEWTLHISGLAFHPDSNVLYGIDNWSRELYMIDTSSGTPVLVNSTDLNNPLGLEFIPEPATLLLLGLGALALLRKPKIVLSSGF